jgi:hypothetical protein
MRVIYFNNTIGILLEENNVKEPIVRETNMGID